MKSTNKSKSKKKIATKIMQKMSHLNFEKFSFLKLNWLQLLCSKGFSAKIYKYEYFSSI